MRKPPRQPCTWCGDPATILLIRKADDRQTLACDECTSMALHCRPGKGLPTGYILADPDSASRFFKTKGAKGVQLRREENCKGPLPPDVAFPKEPSARMEETRQVAEVSQVRDGSSGSRTLPAATSNNKGEVNHGPTSQPEVPDV